MDIGNRDNFKKWRCAKIVALWPVCETSATMKVWNIYKNQGGKGKPLLSNNSRLNNLDS